MGDVYWSLKIDGNFKAYLFLNGHKKNSSMENKIKATELCNKLEKKGWRGR